MTRKLDFRLRLLAAVCLALPLLAGCEERKQAAAPPATPAVGVRPAAMKGVQRSFEFVGRVDGQHKVEQRRIQTGPNRDTDVVVISGLHEGEKVIVDGIQKVRAGQVVQETGLSTERVDR